MQSCSSVSHYLRYVGVLNLMCVMCLSSGGGVTGAGETEGGAEQHPETQQTPPLHHAAVQRNVR